MVAGRMEAAGEVVAGLAGLIPAAVWAPGELLKRRDLNPFRGPAAESEALKAHRAMIEGLKLASLGER